MSNFQSVSTRGLWKKKTISIVPAATSTLISVSEINLKSIHAYISIQIPAEDKYFSAHATISRKNNTWRRVISHRLGDNIGRRISITAASNIVSVNIENLESNNITVSTAYLLI